MHHNIVKALKHAAKVGVVYFSTLDNQRVTARRSEIEVLEYVDDGKNEHIAKVGGKTYRVNYAQLAKLRAFLRSKPLSARQRRSE